MPRPKSIRRIAGIPNVSGFRPYGISPSLKRSEAVFLLYEEYEALRLCDYEKYNQLDASSLMGVSRPTLTRIYISAREKVAQAMVEGRKIIIEGGKVSLDSDWLHCNICGCYFNKREEDVMEVDCALCGATDISLSDGRPDDMNETKVSAHVFCGRGSCKRKTGGKRKHCCHE